MAAAPLVGISSLLSRTGAAPASAAICGGSERERQWTPASISQSPRVRAAAKEAPSKTPVSRDWVPELDTRRNRSRMAAWLECATRTERARAATDAWKGG
eukprot:1061973-Pyramimonas_sp.AAC.1